MLRAISRAVLTSAQGAPRARSFPVSATSVSTVPARRQFFATAASPPTDSQKQSPETDGVPSGSEQGEKHDNIAALKKTMEEAELKFKSDLDQLSERVGELDDKYKRALAETENVRQRLQRQINDAKQFGVQSICKDLLEVVDVLQIARTFAPMEQIEKSEELKNAYDGIAMTEEILQKVLVKHGLEKVEPQPGAQFDPNVHEATFQTQDPNKESNTVALVMKPGYTLHGRLLRAATVGVVKN